MTRKEIRDFISYVYEEIKNGNYEFMNNINTELNIVMSIGEYFKSDTFKQNLKLQKVKNIPHEVLGLIYKPAGGAYSNKTKRTFIYLNHFRPLFLEDIGKDTLTMLVFHELRHAYQDQNKDNSFMSIIYQMEDMKSKLTYLPSHDSWFMEIDADIFGIKEALTFINNHPDMYPKEDLSFLSELYEEKRYLLRNFNYDKLFLNFATLKMKYPNYKTNLEWEHVFFDEKGYLRKIDEIINDPNFDKIDEYFVKRFITSEVFTNSINLNELSEDSIKFLYQQYNLSLDEEDVNYELLRSDNDRSRKKEKYQKKSLARIERYETMIEELSKLLNKYKTLQRRNESLGYISIISMTIGLLILICMFMLLVILKVRI